MHTLARETKVLPLAQALLPLLFLVVVALRAASAASFLLRPPAAVSAAAAAAATVIAFASACATAKVCVQRLLLPMQALLLPPLLLPCPPFVLSLVLPRHPPLPAYCLARPRSTRRNCGPTPAPKVMPHN
jgi:hypothetical protein